MLVKPAQLEPVRIHPLTGRPEINPDRGKIQAWVQGTQRNARVSIAASGTAADSIQVQAEKGLSGDFQVAALTSDHLGAYRAELFAGGNLNRRFSNVPIHVDLLCGTGTLPGYLPVPLLVEARNALAVTFTNLTGITNQVRFVAHGRRFRDYASEAERDDLLRRANARAEWPYWLGLDDTSAALTASSTNNRYLMTVPSEGDFEAEYLLATSTGLFRIAIRESPAGAPIMVGGGDTLGVQSSHVTGSAQYPYRFPAGPAWFRRQTQLEVYLDDLSGAANTVELALVGRVLDYPEGRGRAPIPVNEVRASTNYAGTARPVTPALQVPAVQRWWD